MRKKSILVIGSLESVFVYEYITEVLLELHDFKINVLTNGERGSVPSEWERKLKEANVKIIYNKGPRSFVALKNALRLTIVRHFNYIHILGVSKISFAAALFAKRSSRLCVSYLGSDLLRNNGGAQFLQRILLKRADEITFATDYLITFFNESTRAKYSKKVNKIRYGTNNVKWIKKIHLEKGKMECKEDFSIPTDRTVIFCGYNGARAQKHVEILYALEKLPEEIKEDIFVVLHCSYGLTNDYRNELIETLRSVSYEGMLVTEFLSESRLAEFRMCTDVLLNLQETDAISASMVESLEVGAILIKGTWLHYPDLDEKKTFYISISNENELLSTLCKIVINKSFYEEQVKGNEGIIDLLSWEYNREQWLQMLLKE